VQEAGYLLVGNASREDDGVVARRGAFDVVLERPGTQDKQAPVVEVVDAVEERLDVVDRFQPADVYRDVVVQVVVGDPVASGLDGGR